MSTSETEETVRWGHYINSDILFVTLCCSFTRCYHWGTLGRRATRDLSVLLLTRACESTIISTKKGQFKKINEQKLNKTK